MNHVEPKDIRSIALIGHQGCGKTSLGEAILFLGGAQKTLGSVDGKSAVLDFEPEEKERGGSMGASVGSCEFKGKRIHVVDTPGDGSFTHESRALLQGVDTAVLVVSAVDGVEVETERTWEFATEQGVSRMVFINKMDRERANPQKAIAEIEETLGAKVVPLQLPIGAEADFKGVVDLLRMEARLFKSDKSGKIDNGPVPDELKDEAAAAYERVVEAAAEGKDELIEKYLETGELTNEEMLEGLEAGIRNGVVIPAVFGVATENKGVTRLMEILSVLPAAIERAPRKDADGKDIAPDTSGELVAQVVKSIIDPYAGTVNILRVIRGTLQPETEAFNSVQEKSERLGNVHWIVGKTLSPCASATVGDLVAVSKLKDTHTGDTLVAKGSEIKVPFLEYPPPMATLIVKPGTKADEDKLKEALKKLAQEDPALVIGSDDLTKDITVAGQAHSHIELNLTKLKRKYGVSVTTEVPPVPYRETIRGRTEIEGKHKKQSGGRGQFGVAWLRIEPLTRDGGFEFVDAVVGGAIPRQFIPAVEKGIVGAMGTGPLAGYPVTDVRVTVFDGKHHPVDSSEAAFKMAGSKGFKAGFMKCQPVLLEPIMKMRIKVPEDKVGDVMGDISGRRGRVQSTDYEGSRAYVTALVPLAEVRSYAPDLRSMTQGKGTFVWSLEGYEEVPGNLQEKVIAECSRASDDEDED